MLACNTVLQDQLGYFLSVFKASAAVDPAAAFRAVGLLPSNLQPYTLQQVRDGAGFDPRQAPKLCDSKVFFNFPVDGLGRHQAAQQVF